MNIEDKQTEQTVAKKMIGHSTWRILEEIKKEITLSLGNEVKGVVLYGSYARGEQTGESDMDIVVFYDNRISGRAFMRAKLADIKVDLSLKYDIVISILLKDYRQYERFRKTLPFYSAIYNEGVPLYG